MGAKAETERNRPGNRIAMVSAPWPPMECPVMAWRASSTAKLAVTMRGNSSAT